MLPSALNAPGVNIQNDTSTASVRYPVFVSIVNGQVIREYVSNSKLYYTPSTGVLNAVGFAGDGTGLTGTATTLNIGGNAATATLASKSTNIANGVANQLPYQTAANTTAFIPAPSISGSYLQWTSIGGFAFTAFNGVTSFSADSTGLTPNVATTGAVVLGGTLNASSGGTGASGTLTGYVYANATGAMTAATTIPNTAITGLGTMSTQNANAVAVTGGSINGTTIGASVAAAGSFTTLGVSNYETFTSLATPPTWAQGLLFYEQTNDSLTFYDSITGNDLHLGREIQLRCYNQTGSTIPIGSLVYITGQHSQFPTIALAQANSASTANAIGVTNTAVTNNSYVDVVVLGKFTGVNTSAFTDGQLLYVSATTAGAFTNVAPSYPNLVVPVGYCGYSQPSLGVVVMTMPLPPALATSLSGLVPLTNGGTNANLTATAGGIVYSGASAFSISAAGTSNQVFLSGGAGAPTWANQSALSVGTATNIAGGTAGALPYNTGAGATSFLSLGTTNYVLTAGASAPQYVAQSSLSVGTAATATTATTATNIGGGLANQISYQTGAGATGFITAPTVSGTSLQWNGTGFVWVAGGAGSVTSVGLSLPAIFTVTGSPVTTSGTLTGTLATQTANTVFAGPSTGAAAAPTFRALVAADIPSGYSEFASGTALIFQQTAAPTGWTKVTTNNDAALRVVSGTVGSGGTVGFTTAFASKTPAGTVSTSITGVSGSVGVSGTVGNTTITTTTMPSHSHSAQWTLASQNAASMWAPQAGGGTIINNITNTGGDGAHNHSFSGSGSFTFSSGTASSSFSGTAINLAVKYVDTIIATKN